MNFKDVSDDFATDKIYLNNASVSLMPSQSIEAIKEFLLEYNFIGPDSAGSEPFISEKLQNTRSVISQILSCHPDEVILTQSTTDGVNLVANGIKLDRDSNIVIRGTNHEHHANLYPWLKLGENTSVRSIPIDQNGFFKMSDLESIIDEKTKLVALSHALYNTGAVLPINEIARVLGDAMYFVDSAQSVGCLDVSDLKCDFMAFNGSKWLCGPMGTGLFYCSRDSSKLLEPSAIGGESAVYEQTGLAYKDIPDKFQAGFRNYAGIVGLESSANYLLKFGIGNIRQKNQYLSTLFRDELEKIPNIILYGPDEPKQRTSIVSFNLKGQDPQHIVDKLERQGIILAVREINEQKIIRASPHFFNTEAEMIQVIDAIKSS